MCVGSDVGTNHSTGSDASKVWEVAGLPEAAVALAWAAQQRSRGVVLWSLFRIPDIVAATDTHDNRQPEQRREHARFHWARVGGLPHRAGDLQDSAAFHPVVARSQFRRTFLLVLSVPTLVVRR